MRRIKADVKLNIVDNKVDVKFRKKSKLKNEQSEQSQSEQTAQSKHIEHVLSKQTEQSKQTLPNSINRSDYVFGFLKSVILIKLPPSQLKVNEMQSIDYYVKLAYNSIRKFELSDDCEGMPRIKTAYQKAVRRVNYNADFITAVAAAAMINSIRGGYLKISYIDV